MLLLPQRSRNQASLSQQEENLKLTTASRVIYLSQTHLQCLFCSLQPVYYLSYQTIIMVQPVLQNRVKYSSKHILLSQFSIKPYHFCLHCLQYRVPTLASISVHGNLWYSFSRSIERSPFDFSNEESEFASSIPILFLITSSTACINFWVSSFDQGP